MVRDGIEPPTHGASIQRSTKLSYRTELNIKVNKEQYNRMYERR